MAGTRRVQRDAFTLVELLVVITIIGVLISVLLPAINRAREHGKLTVCLANMHSLGLAGTSYVIDYRDTYPPIYIPIVGSRSQVFWYGKKGTANAFYVAANATTRYLNVYTGRYTPESEVPTARCPNDEQPTTYGTSAFYNTHGSSYSANTTGPNWPHIQSLTVIGSDPTCRYGIRSSIIRDNVRMVMFAEFGIFDPVWSNVDPGINFRWHDRNAISSTVAFTDGHARFMYFTKGVIYNQNYTFDARY